MPEDTELEMLQRLVPDLEAEGYEVYIHPNKPMVPAFLGNFEPDAIALREDKNLVIEVLRRSPGASKKLERITTLLQGQKKWELRAVWLEPTGDREAPQIQTVEAIDKRIEEIKKIAAADHIEPAMLLAWATFEALARIAQTKQFNRPQTPGRLVNVLASDGFLTPTEADRLRMLAEKRNKLIHGELQLRVSKQEMEDFTSVLVRMLRHVRD
jgi:uncharacterized protein YutE (UPF0331/DUF86 family)